MTPARGANHSEPRTTVHPADEALVSLILKTAEDRWIFESADDPERRRELAEAFREHLKELARWVPPSSPGDGLLYPRVRADADLLGTAAALESAWARPLVSEAVRAQTAFNDLARAAVQELLAGTVSTGAERADWVVRTFLPVRSIAAPNIRSHRPGFAGRTVDAVKRMALVAARALLRRWFSAQQRWNDRLLDALGGTQPPKDLLRELRVATDALEAISREVPEAFVAILEQQVGFQRALHPQVSRLLGEYELSFEEDYALWQQYVETQAHVFLRDQSASSPEAQVDFAVLAGPGEREDALRTLETLARITPGRARALVALERDDAPGATVLQVPGLTAEVVRYEGGPASGFAVLATRAQAEWIAFVRAGDSIAPIALAAIRARLRDVPGAAAFFSDEDELDAQGCRVRPFFKPCFSSVNALESDYATRLLVVRADALQRVGGIRTEAGSAALLDVTFRLDAAQLPIIHIPEVLYHRRVVRHPEPEDVQSALGAEGRRVEPAPAGWRMRFEVRGRPLVTAIVPFKDGSALTRQLLESLVRFEPGVEFEVLLVSNRSERPETFAWLSEVQDPRVRKLSWDFPFNYSSVNNFAARHARGEFLLLLNNDVEAIHPGWLAEMVAQAQQPGIGAVGARLLFPDRQLQHAGVVIGPTGFAVHPFWRLSPEATAPFGRSDQLREYSAVTAACLLVRSSEFEAVNGLDESLVVSGGDVDFCLRLRRKGLRIVYTPHATLLHHESATRKARAVIQTDAWNSFRSFREVVLRGDPFYNPNLTLAGQDCSARVDRRPAVHLAAEMLLYRLDDPLRREGSA